MGKAGHDKPVQENKIIEGFFFGFFYPLKSLKLFFRHKKLITYSITPMIINMIIYGSFFILSYRWVIDKTGTWTNFLMGDSGILHTIVQAVFLIVGFLLVLVVCYFAFSILGGLVTAPFYENISQIVEYIHTGSESAADLSFWRDFYVSIIGELQKILFHLVFLILFFLVDFIPGIGSILAFTGWIIFSCFFNAFDFLDYPMTRRQFKFSIKLKTANRNKALTYGFGTMAFLMMFLPVVNVFMKPILVASGTSLYFEKRYE